MAKVLVGNSRGLKETQGKPVLQDHKDTGTAREPGNGKYRR